MDKKLARALYSLSNTEEFKLFLDYLSNFRNELIELLISQNNEEIRGQIKLLNKIIYLLKKENLNNIIEDIEKSQNTYY